MSDNKLKLGILLPTRGLLMTGERPENADSIIALAERVEEAGLDSVWMGDSLTPSRGWSRSLRWLPWQRGRSG